MNDFDTDYTDNIICPYCGCEIGDSWEVNFNSDTELIECFNCDELFHATKYVEVNYSTEKIKKGTCTICGKQNKALFDFDGFCITKKDVCIDCMADSINKDLEESIGGIF